MPGRTRRRRRPPRRGLGPFLLPTIVAAFSVYVATQYAVDWGKQASPAAPIRANAVALAEDGAPPPIAVITTPSPTRMPATSTTVVTPSPTARSTGTPTRAVAPITPSILIGRVPLSPDTTLAAQISSRVAGRSGRYGVAVKNLRTGQGVILDSEG